MGRGGAMPLRMPSYRGSTAQSQPGKMKGKPPVPIPTHRASTMLSSPQPQQRLVFLPVVGRGQARPVFEEGAPPPRTKPDTGGMAFVHPVMTQPALLSGPSSKLEEVSDGVGESGMGVARAAASMGTGFSQQWPTPSLEPRHPVSPVPRPVTGH